MNVLQRVVSLRAVRELSSEDARRLEADWNAVFHQDRTHARAIKKRPRKELLGRSMCWPTLSRNCSGAKRPRVSRRVTETAVD